jgi:malonyl-CoA O-methyltransferase
MLRLRDIRRRFDRAAAGFDDVDFVHAVTRDGLLSRLEPVQVEARNILDLGSATGAAGQSIRRRFRRAHVVSLDLSHAMLERARRRKRLLSKSSYVQADAHRLPFADATFDLVIANQLLPWIGDAQSLFAEVARVLVEGGVFAFATLGPDSFREIRAAWAQANVGGPSGPNSFAAEAAPTGGHVHPFPDMHDIGDALVGARLRDPVLDVDHLAVTYSEAARLFDDLTATGARNALVGRSRGLAGKERFGAMTRALYSGDVIRLDLELVYGHCWGPGLNNDASEFRIDAGKIGRRRRGG